MVDRQKVEAILTRRFPGATRPQVAAAANAIMGMDDEWEEVVGLHLMETWRESDPGAGAEFRVFRRRESTG